MNPIKLLLFPSGTEIAFEINNALKYSKFVEIYAGNSKDDHSKFMYFNLDLNFPMYEDDGFLDYLNDYIQRNQIEYIYPAHDSVQLFLMQHQNDIEANIVSAPMNTVEVCRSKEKTYEYFKKFDFIPKTYDSIDQVSSYPVFVKPKVGQGAVGAQKIDSLEELRSILFKNDDLIICENLAGDEYTVDCFTDQDHALRVVKMRTRSRIKNGIAVRSREVDVPKKIIEIAEAMNQKLVFLGAWFFQVKENDLGEFRLLEVSPRIPGTMGLSRNMGINFPLLTIFCMNGYSLNITDNQYDICLDRAFISRYKIDVEYDMVYVDFDDTITYNGKINLQTLMFLYQCVNNHKKIILLTRHAFEIKESLEKARISEKLFDEIIQVEEEKNKSDYIVEEKAIFIDDSFRERKDVHEINKIPVFDVDMVESLIDWRV